MVKILKLFSRRRLVILLLLISLLPSGLANATQVGHTAAFSLSKSDDAFLEDLSHRIFTYFWEQADPKTGLVLDRAHTDASPIDERHRDVASIAATGFGLTALCIAAERHWIAREQAKERTAATLRFFAERAFHQRGWFYHWMNAKTGKRMWNSEVSSIDSALLLAGVLTARQYFKEDREIVRLATKIYQRVDFKWMLNGDPVLLSHGWKPETGFLKNRWDTYSEDTILYLLAIGSPTHPIKPKSWYGWKRIWVTYEGHKYISGGPLFTHQYSQAWVDYRNRRENRAPYVNYFENSIAATHANRLFCLNLRSEFPGYSENIWGISASDSAKGYIVWSGPPRDPQIDGTVAPYGPGGSLMFTPDISLPALIAMRDRFGAKLYGRYGFADAFNPNTEWYDQDVIGIDQGIILLSAENLRSGNVWRWFMRNSEINRAMSLAGLRKIAARK